MSGNGTIEDLKDVSQSLSLIMPKLHNKSVKKHGIPKVSNGKNSVDTVVGKLKTEDQEKLYKAVVDKVLDLRPNLTRFEGQDGNLYTVGWFDKAKMEVKSYKEAYEALRKTNNILDQDVIDEMSFLNKGNIKIESTKKGLEKA
jgi:hypothetical protein